MPDLKAFLSLAAFGALLVVSAPVMAQNRVYATLINSLPHITMVGTAKVEVEPDLAVITLGVVTQAQSARATSENNARTTSAVVEAAKRSGISNADIGTQSVTLAQLYNDVPDANGNGSIRKPRGFEASNVISVRIHDLDKAGALAQTLIEKGANRFDGIEFTVAHPEPILTKLTAEAIKNAEQMAKTSAEAASVKLGQVLLIKRAGETVTRAPPMFAAARAKAAPTPVEAGTTELSAEMEVTWAIVPR